MSTFYLNNCTCLTFYSIFDYTEKDDSYGFFIGLEILDNLPHDKLVLNSSGIIHEVWVEPPPDTPVNDVITGLPIQFGNYAEKRVPLSDPLIIEFLSVILKGHGYDESFLTSNNNKSLKELSVDHLILWHFLRFPRTRNKSVAWSNLWTDLRNNPKAFFSYFRPENVKRELSFVGASTGGVATERIIYIPTMAYQLLNLAHSSFPNRELIFNDFDYLPESMHGKNGPLVQRTEGNETTSYLSYLDSEVGNCDIFFPTDFDLIELLYEEVYGIGDLDIQRTPKSRVFMSK